MLDPIVIFELDVTFNPEGSWPTFELCGLDDKIKCPFPSASVLIDPTEVPSIETSSVELASAPVTRARKICVAVPSGNVMVVNTACPAATSPLVRFAATLETVPWSPQSPRWPPPGSRSPAAVAQVPFSGSTGVSREASAIVAPATSVKSAGRVPLVVVDLCAAAVALDEAVELKNKRPFPLASVESVPRFVVPLVT